MREQRWSQKFRKLECKKREMGSRYSTVDTRSGKGAFQFALGGEKHPEFEKSPHERSSQVPRRREELQGGVEKTQRASELGRNLGEPG